MGNPAVSVITKDKRRILRFLHIAVVVLPAFQQCGIVFAELAVLKKQRHESEKHRRSAVAVFGQGVIAHIPASVKGTCDKLAGLPVENHSMCLAGTMARIFRNHHVILRTDSSLCGRRFGFQLHVCHDSAEGGSVECGFCRP